MRNTRHAAIAEKTPNMRLDLSYRYRIGHESTRAVA
jgi:hypothetical protein